MSNLKNKVAKAIVETLFIARYWLLLTMIAALVLGTYLAFNNPNLEFRDSVAVFTGGSVVITILYLFLNYEYTQRKFKHDIKSSRDLLSFNIAMEWQKEYMHKNTSLLFKFYTMHKDLIDNNMLKDFQAELNKDENEEYYDAMLIVFNFLESVCLGVKQGIMDEDFIYGFFQTVFMVNYGRYNTYMQFRRREKQNPKLWHNFTELSEKWLSCR